jgi:hypothetical protein
MRSIKGRPAKRRTSFTLRGMEKNGSHMRTNIFVFFLAVLCTVYLAYQARGQKVTNIDPLINQTNEEREFKETINDQTSNQEKNALTVEVPF